MREIIMRQFDLGEVESAAQSRSAPKPRDDIPRVLCGLQDIYITQEVLERVFVILAEVMLQRSAYEDPVDSETGRLGMSQWQFLVRCVLRLALNVGYDRIAELANERQLLSHADLAEQGSWHVRTIKDNLRLFTPEHLVRINQVVVDVGHTLVKKACTMDWLCAVTPSWSRTMHFPADINLLYDAVHKEIEISAKLCDEQDLSDWRQSTYNLRCLKKAYRHVQSLKRSKSKDKRTARSEAIKQARRDYLRLAGGFQLRAQPTGRSLATVQSVTLVLFAPLDDYIPHGKRIVHEEKVFSIFEPHAERIN